MGISQGRVIRAIKLVLVALASQGAVGKAVSEKVSRELFGTPKSGSSEHE